MHYPLPTIYKQKQLLHLKALWKEMSMRYHFKFLMLAIITIATCEEISPAITPRELGKKAVAKFGADLTLLFLDKILTREPDAPEDTCQSDFESLMAVYQDSIDYHGVQAVENCASSADGETCTVSTGAYKDLCVNQAGGQMLLYDITYTCPYYERFAVKNVPIACIPTSCDHWEFNQQYQRLFDAYYGYVDANSCTLDAFFISNVENPSAGFHQPVPVKAIAILGVLASAIGIM
mmetsp:Transcript_11835/g.17264  ORF Transcript_11835/g.17264 Transcript_11835/m.17264 type:complete len:235 (-) Transcript_11835:197-901(-)